MVELAAFALKDVGEFDSLVERIQKQIDSVSRLELPSSSSSSPDPPTTLTPAEERLLRRGVRVFGFGSKVDTQKNLLPTKPLEFLEARLNNDRQKSVKQWFGLEDAFLAALVQKHGFQWTMIQTMLPHKTKGQVRRRWKQIETTKKPVPSDVKPTQRMCVSARNAAIAASRSTIPYEDVREEDEYEELSSSDGEDDDTIIPVTTTTKNQPFADEDDFFEKIVRRPR